MLTHGSLFSGIGGFELAAKWAGIPTLWNCEIEPFNRKILKKHFPEAIQYEDIRELRYPPKVDIVSGGFPCQPFSSAGKRKGVEDNRYLWPEMLRVISEVQPKYIIGENVYGLTNINEGLVFEQVYVDLETQGYEVQPFIIPACAVNAPHRRDRVWILAYAHRLGCDNEQKEAGLAISNGNGFNPLTQQGGGQQQCGVSEPSPIPDPDHSGLQRSEINGGIRGSEQECAKQSSGLFRAKWQDFPTQSPVCGRDDGIPDRVDRLKSLGNGIVPQIAQEIFDCIKEFDQRCN